MARMRAFTLIELLIVLSIIALLASIAVPRYFNSLEKSKVQVLKENLNILRTSLDRYAADKGHYPATLNELVSEKYLKAIPVDPETDSNATWKPVVSSDPAQDGIIDIHSGASGNSRDGVAFGSL